MSLRPRQVDFESVWLNIRETSLGVMTLAPIERHTWNDRFADVYDLCVAFPEPHVSRLYSELKNFLREHVESLQKQVETGGDVNLLSCYHRAWLVYNQGSLYLDKLFMYLNTQHLKKKKISLAELIYGSFEVDGDSGVLEVRELALSLWRRHMIEPFQQRLVQLLLERINCLRRGQLADGEQSLVRDTVHSLVVVDEYKVKPLELYESAFERAFLDESGRYFSQLAASLLQTHDVCGYMRQVLQAIVEERARCVCCLNASSVERALSELRRRLVDDHLQWILSDAGAMISDEREQDLRNLYDLLKPLPRAEPLHSVVRMLEDHIRKQGLQLLASGGRGAAGGGGGSGDTVAAAFVDAVLAVYDKFSKMVDNVFHSDQLLLAALERSCTAVVNQRAPAVAQAGARTHCSAPELLVRYCDQLLRKTARGAAVTSSGDMNRALDRAVSVYHFLEDKDAFQKHYQRFMCKRLLYDTSAGVDWEELMVSSFRRACEYDFTNKLNQMLRDISVSVDHTSEFLVASQQHQAAPLSHGLSVKVIQSGAWPVFAPAGVTFHVPHVLERCVQQFETFYQSKFNGRRLTWLHHLSQTKLKLLYLRRVYVVTMHTFAMALLVMFERVERVSLDEMADTTALPADHLARNVQALVDARLLLTDACTTAAHQTYSLNMQFSHKWPRLRVQTAAVAREQVAEREHTQRELDEARKMCVQAAIVRIMKARKRQRHNELVQEVLAQTSRLFQPQVSVIKKCIEVLVEKEYIARAPDAPDEYSYVA